MKPNVATAHAFYNYHLQKAAFVIPNPWDPGSARVLAQAGFTALATTSAGYAFSRGRPDNAIVRAEMMQHVADIAAATELPLSADLENGFGDAPESVARTILEAAAAGAVGGSIEDSVNKPGETVYPLPLAVDRIRAAVEAVRSLPFRFTLTARAENYLVGIKDLSDTIERLQAYEDAGADVLYAPGVMSREDIAAIISSVDRPVNVNIGIRGSKLSVHELSDLGVKRVSVGGSLARAALGALLRAAQELRELGTSTYEAAAPGTRDMNARFEKFEPK